MTTTKRRFTPPPTIDRSIDYTDGAWLFHGLYNTYTVDGSLPLWRAYNKAIRMAPHWDCNGSWENVFVDPQWFPQLEGHI